MDSLTCVASFKRRGSLVVTNVSLVGSVTIGGNSDCLVFSLYDFRNLDFLTFSSPKENRTSLEREKKRKRNRKEKGEEEKIDLALVPLSARSTKNSQPDSASKRFTSKKYRRPLCIFFSHISATTPQRLTIWPCCSSFRLRKRDSEYSFSYPSLLLGVHISTVRLYNRIVSPFVSRVERDNKE